MTTPPDHRLLALAASLNRWWHPNRRHAAELIAIARVVAELRHDNARAQRVLDELVADAQEQALAAEGTAGRVVSLRPALTVLDGRGRRIGGETVL